MRFDQNSLELLKSDKFKIDRIQITNISFNYLILQRLFITFYLSSWSILRDNITDMTFKIKLLEYFFSSCLQLFHVVETLRLTNARKIELE